MQDNTKDPVVLICDVDVYRVGHPGFERCWSYPGAPTSICSGPGTDALGSYPGPVEPSREHDYTSRPSGSSCKRYTWQVCLSEVPDFIEQVSAVLSDEGRIKSWDAGRLRFLQALRQILAENA